MADDVLRQSHATHIVATHLGYEIRWRPGAFEVVRNGWVVASVSGYAVALTIAAQCAATDEGGAS